jgi:uncharacterized protein DUF1566
MSPDTVPSLTRRIMGVLVGILLLSVPAVGLPSDPRTNVQAQGSRFQILEEYKGEAVLDTETHLIWERTPSSAETAWANASLRCALTSTGGRLGWRLPSFLELMTLVEPAPPATATKPSLPASHPFRGVRADPYWTTSSQDTDPTNAYAIDFLRGDVTSQRKNQAHAWWCVRGGASSPPAMSARVRPQESI